MDYFLKRRIASDIRNWIFQRKFWTNSNTSENTAEARYTSGYSRNLRKKVWKPISWDDPRGHFPREQCQKSWYGRSRGNTNRFYDDRSRSSGDHALLAASHMSAWKYGPLATGRVRNSRASIFPNSPFYRPHFAAWRAKPDRPAIYRSSCLAICRSFVNCLIVQSSQMWHAFERISIRISTRDRPRFDSFSDF